jgi:uncharacterized phage protein gp47/JayE
MTNFQKDFDTLFNALLTDWLNQYPEADLSKGSLIYVKSACLASALWGLYKYQDWIATQIFPDTAETAQLEHHAWVRVITRTVGETDADLLARLLEYIRRPPAGGNQYDYVKWVLSLNYVAKVWCFPLAQGLGTVDVVILAHADTTGSEIPSSHAMAGTATSLLANKLIDGAANFTNAVNPVRIGDVAVNNGPQTRAVVTGVDSATQLSLDTDIFTVVTQAYTVKSLTVQVHDYIDGVRPVTASVVRILPPTPQLQDVTMAVTGPAVDKIKIAAQITAYMQSLIPGQPLYRTQLSAIAVAAGADNATITVPAADVIPAGYAMLRPGNISVT